MTSGYVPDGLMDMRYVSEVQPYLDDSGEIVFTVSTVECPQLKEKRITVRSAASRDTAERFCLRLMKLLGIEEKGPLIPL